MAQVYFHCSTTERVLIDRSGSTLGDLTEALDHAALVIQSLIMSPSLEDWRGWVLHVSDDAGKAGKPGARFAVASTRQDTASDLTFIKGSAALFGSQIK